MKSVLHFVTMPLRQMVLPLLFIMFSFPLLAQVKEFPLTYQLYPRNIMTNKATVIVSGKIKRSDGFREMRLKVYRNTELKYTRSIRLDFNWEGNASYFFRKKIYAELANYTFNLFGVSKYGQETLLKSADSVVAGDAYIIQGQSNAVANSRVPTGMVNNADDPSNAPNRHFVRVYGSGSATFAFTKAWFIGKGNVWFDNDGQTGQWAMRLASNIAGAKNIPIAIFNGASPGDPIAYFARNDANPGDLNTNYGRLLQRIKEAGLQNNIRGLIWYQGESDVLGTLSSTQLTTEQYKTAFKELVKDWKRDYDGLSRFYLFQIRFGCGMSNADNCLKIQEAQRQVDKESPEIITISPANTTQLFDGGTISYCHYEFVDGYKKIGDWVSPLLLRDLYHVKGLPAAIESPEPLKASFSVVGSGNVATQVKLLLKDQSSAFTINGDLSTMFRLDGGTYLINSVTVNGNSVFVNFTRGAGTTTNPVSISYRGHDMAAAPVLTNSLGLALLNFEYLPINTHGHPGSFINIPNNQGNETALVNNKKLEGISAYPNPVTDRLIINYPVEQAGRVELKVFDLTGRVLTVKNVEAVNGQNQFQLDVSALHSGVYFLQIRKGNELIARKFIVGAK